MVTLKGRFKGETGEKCHILPLQYIMDLVIEVRIWVGRWLEVFVEEDNKLEVWGFKGREGRVWGFNIWSKGSMRH